MPATVWDPGQYLRYRDERARPFVDLLARVPVAHPARVVDLGCGPGNLTATLAERWPQADVLGVDSSPLMIERAQEQARAWERGRDARTADGTAASGGQRRVGGDGAAASGGDGDGGGSLSFRLGDLRAWRPAEPVDVIVSNATLQWVPDHLALLRDLVAALRPGGWLAFQVPANFQEPSHRILADLARSPRWRDRLAQSVRDAPVHDAATYLDQLARLGCAPDVWETTYLHVLPGQDAVLDWVKGTALRPYLSRLAAGLAEEFTAEYGAALRAAYPARPYGTVLPFRRIFAVAQKAGQG